MSIAAGLQDRTIELDGKESGHAEAVAEELHRILESRFFRNATRSRQFLEFVVRHKLDGHADQLKERTIGTELFRRSPGYATGDDPVVRVQAGEVRRRLDQFYQAEPNHGPVKIELPVGSYSPRFVWALDEKISPDVSQQATPETAEPEPMRGRRKSIIIALAVGLVGILAVTFVLFRSTPKQTSMTQQSRIQQFWAPVFATPQPLLICLAKPVVYRPTLGLYRRYSDKHPGTFATEVERSNQVLPLKPEDKLTWNEIGSFPDYGVAVGDVYAAVQLSGWLGKIGKPTQVRIGSHYSFEDLRNSPSVLVGAFNNKWTMQLSPNLHFAFVEENGQMSLREQIANGRQWIPKFRQDQQFGDDYAIVARLLDSKTGQFTVIAAGMAGTGTQAAGEFVSNPEFLERGLRGAPADWQSKNMELVLQTSVTDFVAGPPKVVAAYYW